MSWKWQTDNIVEWMENSSWLCGAGGRDRGGHVLFSLLSWRRRLHFLNCPHPFLLPSFFLPSFLLSLSLSFNFFLLSSQENRTWHNIGISTFEHCILQPLSLLSVRSVTQILSLSIWEALQKQLTLLFPDFQIPDSADNAGLYRKWVWHIYRSTICWQQLSISLFIVHCSRSRKQLKIFQKRVRSIYMLAVWI